MIVDVYHAASVKVTKNMIAEEVKKKFKKNHISIFGMRKLYGGGRTKCFALVYDSEDAMKKIEPKFRQIRNELEKLPKDQRKREKKEGRKVLKLKKNQNARKRATKRRQEMNLKRKQNKKK